MLKHNQDTLMTLLLGDSVCGSVSAYKELLIAGVYESKL